jgi:hypothetical protein
MLFNVTIKDYDNGDTWEKSTFQYVLRNKLL